MTSLRLAAAALALAYGAGPTVAAPPVEADATAPAADDELSRLSRRLSSRLDELALDPCLRNARFAMTVRDLQSGRALHARSADTAMIPASNQKLLTAAALLGLLGPERVLWTEFRGEHEPSPDGDVGDLYVVGRGDPALTVEALHAASRSLAAAGVRRVRSVVADSTYFDGPERPPSWPERNHPYWYGAPAAALSTNFAVVAVHARGGVDGQPATAWVDPYPSYFELATGLRSGRGPWSIRSELLPAAGGGPAQRLTLVGRVPSGRTERQLRAVEDPALFAAHGVTESLRRVGIEVLARPRHGVAPESSELLHSQPSKPLGLLVHDMNKESSNVFAETLLKVLGAELVGAPGTREKGLLVLRTYLEQASPRASACRLEDASGLSPENRMTANVIADVLQFALSDPYTQPEFLVALPVGGVDGTLRRRMDDGRARRNVRAKTGRLSKVVSLSGWARVEQGRQVVFSILVNDYPCQTWKAQDRVDGLVEVLVSGTPRAPELAGRVSLDVAAEGAGDGSEQVGRGGN